METAEFDIIFNGSGSTLHLSGVTPAEFQVLRHLHQANAGKHIVELGTFKINGIKGSVKTRKPDGTPDEIGPFPPILELNRIKARYEKKPANVVSRLFPGTNPTLPTKFAEVGVSEDGKSTLQEAQSVAVINEAGEVVEVAVASTQVPVAPKTDGLPQTELAMADIRE